MNCNVFVLFVIFKIFIIINCNEYIIDNYDYDNTTIWDYSDNNVCIFDNLIEKLTPNDLEEGKRMKINKYVNNINETVHRIYRLKDLAENATNILFKTFLPQFYEFGYETDLSPQCLSALIRIFEAMNNAELWSAKCKAFNTLLILF
jgi:hypothetical protein